MLEFTRIRLFRSDDAPKLLAALKEMKDGLDLVRTKVESLARKVPAAFPPPSHNRPNFGDEERMDAPVRFPAAGMALN